MSIPWRPKTEYFVYVEFDPANYFAPPSTSPVVPPIPPARWPPSRRERRVCAVFACRPPFPPGLTFHRFPRNPSQQQRWAALCQRDLARLRVNSARVCSQHFLPADYERDLPNELLGRPIVKRLRTEAVPSLRMEEDNMVNVGFGGTDRLSEEEEDDGERDPLSQEDDDVPTDDVKDQDEEQDEPKRYRLRGSTNRSKQEHEAEKHAVTEFFIQALKESPAVWQYKHTQCHFQFSCSLLHNSWQSVRLKMRENFESSLLRRQKMWSVTEMKKMYGALRTSYSREKKSLKDGFSNDNKASRWKKHLRFLDLASDLPCPGFLKPSPHSFKGSPGVVCDRCDFTSLETDDLLKHIVNEHPRNQIKGEARDHKDEGSALHRTVLGHVAESEVDTAKVKVESSQVEEKECSFIVDCADIKLEPAELGACDPRRNTTDLNHEESTDVSGVKVELEAFTLEPNNRAEFSN